MDKPSLVERLGYVRAALPATTIGEIRKGLADRSAAGSAQGVERERMDEGRKKAASDYTERFSGGIKVNLDVPNPIEICGRT